MSNSATIVSASLDDNELRQSIANLVAHYKRALHTMSTDTDKTVAELQNKLKGIGQIKIDSGGAADGGSSRRTSKQKEEETQVKATTQAYKEQSVSLDQLASAQQKAIRLPSEMRMPDVAKSARESFQAFYKGFNEQARQIEPLIQSWEKLLQARHTGNIEQVAQKIAQVKHEIAELVKEQANLSKTKPQGYLDEIAKRNPQIKALRDQLISLETEHQKLKASDPFKDNPYLNTLREKLQGVKSAMNDADTTNRRWLQTTQQLTEAQKKSVDEQMKLFYTRTMKIPTDQYDMQIAKLERIQSLLQSYRRGEVSFTPAQLSGLEKEERTLLSIVGAHREIYQTQQQVASSTQQTVQSAHQYTEEIRKQAQAIRESQQWKEKGFVTIGNNNFYNPDTSKLPQKERLSLEEQIYQAQTKQIEAAAQQEKVQQGVTQAVAATVQMQENVHIAQKRQNEWAAQKGMSKTVSDDVANLRTQIADLLGVQEREVKMINVERASYDELSAYIKQLQSAYSKLGGDIAGRHGKDIADELQRAQREAQKFQQQMSRPTSLKAAMGLEDKTLDDIIYKMRQLSSYKMGLNITDPKAMEEMRQVDTAINRLKKQYDDLMGKNQSMIASNNALGRSWNYMKNRLAFYFTVGASTQFVKSLIDIRGQYELLERSIGILIDSAQNGSQIFAELNSMAIKSPFTTMELGAAAKQLVAYDVAAKDVVDTTRRLADMAAAVGIPIERLTYALGQIKAYGYLNARDARMFANAGIPLVKELADRYTELEGRLVSTSDVYDRIKKKAISYEDVMATVNKMTDEGGKFFNFQEKAADTLKVRIANLTLAWNNMLNEMGKDNQGVLAGGLKMLKDVFEHWRDIHNIIISIITTLGVLKATQVAVLTITAMHIKKNITLWTALEFAMRKSIGAAVVNNLRSIGSLLARFANPLSIAAAVVTAFGIAIGKAVLDYRDLIAANEAFNKSISDNAKENIKSIEKFFEEYKKQLSNIGGLNNADQEKLWERIQEEIEKTTKNAEDYIRVLNDVKNVSSRIRLGEDILEQSKTIQGELQRLADSGTFSIGGGFANDSAAENLQNYQKTLNEIRQEYGSVNEAIDAHTMKSRKLMADYTTQRNEVRAELNDFVSKLNNAYMPEILGQSNDVDIQMANVRSFAESLRDAFIATEEGSKIGADGIVLLNNAIDKWITKQGVANNLIVNANGDFDEQRARIEENKTAWEEFFRYVSKKDREYLDAAIKTNNIGSDEVKKIWDKAAEEMSKRATTSYDLIQDQIAQLRNTPDIVINVVYRNEKEKLEKDQEEFQNKYIRPKGWSTLSPDKYLEQEKANREKYGTLMRKQGEDTVEYEKRISDERKANLALQKKNGDIIEENKNKTDAYSEAVTKQAKKEKAAADERLKFIKEVEDAGGYDFSTKSENAAARKAQKQAESELAKALKDELSTIDKVRSIYKDLTKEGMSHADAVKSATDGWNETVNAINKVLTKNGLKALNLADFVGIDNPREILNTLQSQLKELVKRGASTSEIRVLQTKIQTVSVEADKYDLTKITKGLNNELDKLKDEYELAVELDANPELGDMFADMFGIDTSTLPQTFGEALDRAQIIINRKLAELNVSSPFDLMQTDINKFANSAGLEKESEAIKELAKWQNTFRDMFKKNLLDSEKMLDDYVKKYGGYSDKIAEIEADRLEKIKKLNDAYYTEEMRQRPEYIAKMNAINQGASREKSNVEFDAFKNSRYYTMMFENLDYISTKTIRDMRDRLRELMDSMKDLEPEQLKQIMSQYEKLEQKLVKRSPFKTLTKDLKNYLKTSGDRKAANEAFRNAQKEYDAQEKNVAALKEKYEQAKANNNTSQSYLDFLQIEINAQSDILDIFKKQLELAEKKADKYNLMAKLAKSEMLQVAQTVAANLKGLAELRDQMNELFGVDASKGETLLGHQIDGLIDGLSKASDGISKITSSAQSGNVFGVASGVVDVFTGIGDGIASLFGDGSARTKRLNREINESRETVRQLSMAYDDLERAINKSLGTGETEARRLAIANKEAQLAELERQKELEQSKRSKDRDDDAIKQYEETIHSLRNEIDDLKEDVINNLWGEDVKSAAEAFVDAWVQAWRAGETTLDAIQEKMDEMIYNLIKKAMTSKIVETLLNPIYKELDRMTKEGSEGGVALTTNELRQLAQQAGITAGEINTALGEFYGNLERLGIVSKTEDESNELSALQQGIQNITETTAGALEAYMNGVSQQVYYQSDLMTQIRDAVVGFDLDVQVATMSQILLQLQSSYTVQMSIQGILEGWSSPSGLAVRVEMQ